MEENKDYESSTVLTLFGCMERWGQDRGRKIYDGLVRQTRLFNDGITDKDIHKITDLDIRIPTDGISLRS